jgi:hypothetical protein
MKPIRLCNNEENTKVEPCPNNFRLESVHDKSGFRTTPARLSHKITIQNEYQPFLESLALSDFFFTMSLPQHLEDIDLET